MFVEPSSAISVGLAVLENRKKLWPLLKKMRFLLTHGRLQIAIFGPGGTGKTTLGQILAGNLGPASSPTTYKESIGIESYSLKGDVVCSLLVAPGQRRRAEYTWPLLFKSLAQGDSSGVINVVSWGYHSFQKGDVEETIRQ
jgi:GTPase SAR1 family protein